MDSMIILYSGLCEMARTGVAYLEEGAGGLGMKGVPDAPKVKHRKIGPADLALVAEARKLKVEALDKLADSSVTRSEQWRRGAGNR